MGWVGWGEDGGGVAGWRYWMKGEGKVVVEVTFGRSWMNRARPPPTATLIHILSTCVFP